VWCPFIGSGRRSAGEVGFEDFGYEVLKKGGEALGCHLMRGLEEAPAALRFDFIPTLEVNVWRRAERWQAGEQRLGQRKETTTKVGSSRVGHVGAVMLTGLAQNRKKEKKEKARDGLDRG
jgi:hypothetical protein